MSIADQAKKSKIKYSGQAIALLEQIKEDFDLEEFEKWTQDHLFVIGSMYIVDYLNFRKDQKQKANKKLLCNPQK
jgi:hypothetical protein